MFPAQDMDAVWLDRSRWRAGIGRGREADPLGALRTRLRRRHLGQVAKGVTIGTRCQPLEGLPACDWHIFAGWGALIGALTLPTLVLWRLRRRDRAAGFNRRFC